jgi:hypothetical protein
MMPVSQGRIQRQPEFRGLSQEMRLENATLALPATGALVQRKLTLGTPGDMYEQEADRVARQVVDEIHSSPIREQNALSEEERIPAGGEAGRVQRQITVRSAGDAGGELSSEWEGELQRAKSGGQPLSPSVKEPMERAFGADFGGVRVHTGAQADGLARSIQAKAFTTGQDVFFRQGAYEPGSRRWEELLAHELTHVVQQRGNGMGQQPIQRMSFTARLSRVGKKLLEDNLLPQMLANVGTTAQGYRVTHRLLHGGMQTVPHSMDEFQNRVEADPNQVRRLLAQGVLMQLNVWDRFINGGSGIEDVIDLLRSL